VLRCSSLVSRLPTRSWQATQFPWLVSLCAEGRLSVLCSKAIPGTNQVYTWSYSPTVCKSINETLLQLFGHGFPGRTICGTNMVCGPAHGMTCTRLADVTFPAVDMPMLFEYVLSLLLAIWHIQRHTAGPSEHDSVFNLDRSKHFLDAGVSVMASLAFIVGTWSLDGIHQGSR